MKLFMAEERLHLAKAPAFCMQSEFWLKLQREGSVACKKMLQAYRTSKNSRHGTLTKKLRLYTLPR